jgi:hypothetical protein
MQKTIDALKRLRLILTLDRRNHKYRSGNNAKTGGFQSQNLVKLSRPSVKQLNWSQTSRVVHLSLSELNKPNILSAISRISHRGSLQARLSRCVKSVCWRKRAKSLSGYQSCVIGSDALGCSSKCGRGLRAPFRGLLITCRRRRALLFLNFCVCTELHFFAGNIVSEPLANMLYSKIQFSLQTKTIWIKL